MIGFSAPWALIGLLAAAFPLLLHLTQRREPPEQAFPAVRYLDDATREHRRRLKLRHWLLLAVRTLLILALVLAAAGMRLTRARVGGHPPSALVLILDNSASSAAVIDGTPLLTRLLSAGREVLGQATAADRVWLITADGVAHAGSAATLSDQLIHMTSVPLRLDLGAAVEQAHQLTQGSGLPREVVVVSDLQRSALSRATTAGPILVLGSSAPVSANRGLQEVEPLALPWGMAGGEVRVLIASNDTTPVPVTISLGSEGSGNREVLVTPGVPALIRIKPTKTGWSAVTMSIPPDEFRLDDTREVAVEIAPPAVVRWNVADRFIDAAASVLVHDGRLLAGEGNLLGSLGPGPSVVVPPEDAAQLGALNRALSARGIPWEYGTLVTAPEHSDSATLLPVPIDVAKRVTLHATGGSGDLLVAVGGAPWLVRGGGVLLSGSRFDPTWTALPLSAEFVPFLDALLTRTIRGAPSLPTIAAGERIALPGLVRTVSTSGNSTSVEGGAPWRSNLTGIHYLMAGADTIGAISVGIDPRESVLTSASAEEVKTLWPEATVATLQDGPGLAFGHGRGDLRTSLLILALICVVAETFLARRGAGAPA